MAPPASTRTPDERRALLVREAAQEFARSGYEQASLNRIVRACGMSKSSFYHLVPSKEALFDLVVDTLREDVGQRLTVPPPEAFAADFWRTARDLLRDLVEVSTSDPSLAALGRLVYLDGLPSEPRGAVQSFFADLQTWLGEVLDHGRTSGAVRDDLPADLQLRLVVATLKTLDEWSLAQLDQAPAEDLRTWGDAQLALVQRMLATDAA
ncbi:TetR/AcrR family transcriptional regulator [Pseudactinotalea suaedae]|uniref:TetR/AcrR family transcriptional regulator n=1 Tax=Pseudactinotalea suaedae TaxID=1524924 RepID=UPI0012E2F3EE|nr:TetR/AcrR family transcriptional regulator [Pseudactinotalea suaedae]